MTKKRQDCPGMTDYAPNDFIPEVTRTEGDCPSCGSPGPHETCVYPDGTCVAECCECGYTKAYKNRKLSYDLYEFRFAV